MIFDNYTFCPLALSANVFDRFCTVLTPNRMASISTGTEHPIRNVTRTVTEMIFYTQTPSMIRI